MSFHIKQPSLAFVVSIHFFFTMDNDGQYSKGSESLKGCTAREAPQAPVSIYNRNSPVVGDATPKLPGVSGAK